MAGPAKLIGAAGLALALLMGTAGGGLWWALTASLPESRGDIALPGLSGPVTVHYDAWQRPSVGARTLRDALSAQGWLHASHRLWQMELYRRAGGGRMSEMLGPDLVATDRQLWRFGVPQLARRLASNASPTMRNRVDAYVDGVNAAIARYSLPPPEFLLLRQQPQPWTAADVFAVGALMAFQSSNNARREILRQALRKHLGDQRFALFLEDGSARSDFPFVLPGDGGAVSASPGIPPHEKWLSALDALDPVDPAHQPLMPRLAFGSNGWVVSPSRSATGNALYAFDSHDRLGLPNLFYEVHLFFDGDRQIRGWSVPGLPGVINGYNEAIAWGFTNIGDSQDLFLETPVAGRPGYFREGDQEYAARTETVKLAVHGAQPVTLRILHTRNGPLVSDTPPLSLRWTVQDIGDLGLDGLLALNLARDWEEFNAASDLHAAPVLNATYADRDGNIGFRTAGLLPLRARGDGLLPLPAGPDARWPGLVPAADMPRLTNPASGFIAAANARVNPPGSYPLISADNAAPYRIRRLQSVLAGGDLLTLEIMRELQRDWYDAQAAMLLPALLAPLAENPQVARERDMLTAWQLHPVAAPDSAAALLFQTWYLELAADLFREPLGDALFQRLLEENYLLNFALDTLILSDHHEAWWPAPRNEVLAETLAMASTRLEAELGPAASWRLDRKQTVGLGHELSAAVPLLARLFDVPDAPWGGSPAAVGRANYRYSEPFDVVHGATVRAVGNMGERPAFSSVIPGGQSGHPLSTHYADQFATWRRGELLNIPATPTGKPAFTLVPEH